MNALTLFLEFFAILAFVVIWYVWLIPTLLLIPGAIFLWITVGAVFVPLIAILYWVIHE